MDFFNILFLVMIFIVISCVIYFWFYGNTWIQDDVLKMSIQQKVNRKLLRNEIKKLKHTDIYNIFVIYDDLEIKFYKDIDIQAVIDINRNNDKPLDIRYNEYTRSYHICHKDHYKKVMIINERK